MDEGELDMDDATETMLTEVIVKAKQKFVYTYDFGDGWDHDVVVEEIGASKPGTRYPVCLKGSRACPPEDVGGVSGYVEYLEALGDPTHDRHDEFMRWRGEFDPEAIDLDAINKALRKRRR